MVVPLPADWVIVEAFRSNAVKLLTLTTVKSPIRVDAPAFAAKVMFPVSAVRVKEPGPSTAPEKIISPGPIPVFSDAVPVKVTPLPNWMLSFVVVIVIDPPSWLVPVPDWVNGPSRDSAPLGPSTNVPAMEIVAGPLSAVVTELLIVRLFPVKAKPAAPLKVTAPFKVVVPVPAA